MGKWKEAARPVIGRAALALAAGLLPRELRGLKVKDVAAVFAAIPLTRWLAALASTVLAYFALANYDRVALEPLGRRLDFRYVALASFTSYALGHNLGQDGQNSGHDCRYHPPHPSNRPKRSHIFVFYSLPSFPESGPTPLPMTCNCSPHPHSLPRRATSHLHLVYHGLLIRIGFPGPPASFLSFPNFSKLSPQ